MLKEKYGYLLKRQFIIIIILVILLFIYSIIITILFLDERNFNSLVQENKTINQKENKKTNLPDSPKLKISKNLPPAKGKIYYSQKHGNERLTNKRLSLSVDYEEALTSTVTVDRRFLISNDGTKLAYYDNNFGLAIKDLITNKDTLFLENKKTFNEPTKTEIYMPKEWSPDSNKLIVEIGYWESSSLGVIDVNTKKFGYVNNVDGTRSGCINGKWMQDSERIVLYGYNYGHPCNIMSGLYILNIFDMKTKPLFGTNLESVTFSVEEPYEKENNTLLFKAYKDFDKVSDADGIYEIDTNSRLTNKLNIDYLGKVWLDDNSYFYATDKEIVLYNLNTKTSKTIIDNQDNTLALIPVNISPDKKYLVYVMRVVKLDKFGNYIYANREEENILKAYDLETGKSYDLAEDVDVNSPIIWLPE